jgi:hypothetical protein
MAHVRVQAVAARRRGSGRGRTCSVAGSDKAKRTLTGAVKLANTERWIGTERDQVLVPDARRSSSIQMARDERFRHHSTRWWHRVQQGCNHATVHAWADVCAFSQLLMLTLSAMLNNNETSGQTVARRSSADHTFEHARSATQHHHSHHAPDRPWHRPSPPRS